MFSIDRYSPIPIYEQLIAQFERLILVGILAPNEMLPSVRALSQELSVNPNTIQKAYAELERRGLSQTAPGTGRFITPNALQILRQGKDELLEQLRELAEQLATYGIAPEEAQEALREGYRRKSEKGDESK